MKNCAFTICTRSYLGLALTLKQSFLKYNDNFDFYIIIADDDKTIIPNEYILNAKEIMNLSNTLFMEMAFKYNVTEFCTSIKPFGFDYFFNKKYPLVAYFDPDIYFYSQFTELYDNKFFSIYLTPHILFVELHHSGEWQEEEFLKVGVYNCGFIAMRNNKISNEIVRWWKEKLITKSFVDIESGIYTDQHWIDFIPSFVNQQDVLIIRNMGTNLAPWNFYEREIIKKNDGLYIKKRIEKSSTYNIDKLCFLHFSGYKYKELIENYTIPIDRPKKYDDIKPLIINYAKELKKMNADSYLNLNYTFSYFSNGVEIQKIHRRFLRQLGNEGMIFLDPFSYQKNSFYSLLNKSRLIDAREHAYVLKKTIKNISLKEKILENIFRCLFLVLGVSKYVLFLRCLPFYSRFESHIFLLKQENNNV
jgi:hypothetical protein